MKYRLMAMVCAFASTAAAQLGNYLGPGILTHGAGDIGVRSGEDVDLRFFVSANGTYDNGIQPLAVDSKGNLITENGVYGTDISWGVYGVHQWRTSQLGLDYRGDYRYYPDASYGTGSDQMFTAGYTVQKSKRVYFDLVGMAGTLSQAVGAVPGVSIPVPTFVTQPTALLFDNRVYFGEGGASVTYLLTARTSFTAGGQGFVMRQQSSGLIGMNGYSLRGSIQHRLSRRTTIGGQYGHMYFIYPGLYGDSTINTAQGFLGMQLGRRWTFSISGGAYETEVSGIQQVAVDPTIAAILGIMTTNQTFYLKGVFPAGSVRLTRQFKNSSLGFAYERSVTPGNGVYLTSRMESAAANYSYTGFRKLNMGATVGEYSFSSIGQNIPPYRQFSGGAGFTYTLTHALHLVARYDARHQEIYLSGFRTNSYRISFGMAFSPGSVPLSLW